MANPKNRQSNGAPKIKARFQREVQTEKGATVPISPTMHLDKEGVASALKSYIFSWELETLKEYD